MSEIAVPSYTKVAALGHRSVGTIWEGDVEVTEKIDGSQFAFGVVGGELYMRSKGRQIPRHSVTPQDLFFNTIQQIEDRFEHGVIPEDYWFYGEAIGKNRHSTLNYENIPQGNFVLWAARHVDDETAWFPYGGLVTFAESMEVDIARRVSIDLSDEVRPAEALLAFLSGRPKSQLGAALNKKGEDVGMEGVVVKNLGQEMLYGPILFPVMAAKFVTEQFKEVHQADWKAQNTGKGRWDLFQEQYRTEARWMKTIMHLAEDGQLVGEPKDIGLLMNMVQKDIGQECKEEITKFLWKQFGRDLMRNAVRGLPEWYKEQIALGNIEEILNG